MAILETETPIDFIMLLFDRKLNTKSEHKIYHTKNNIIILFWSIFHFFLKRAWVSALTTVYHHHRHSTSNNNNNELNQHALQIILYFLYTYIVRSDIAKWTRNWTWSVGKCGRTQRERRKNKIKTLIYCLSLHRWNSLETHNSMSKLCIFNLFKTSSGKKRERKEYYDCCGTHRIALTTQNNCITYTHKAYINIGANV